MQALRDTTLESVLRPDHKARRRGLKADCGAPSRLPAMPENEARFWAAMGIALALKAQHAHGRAETNADAARRGGVVVVYARLGEGSPALWRKVLAFAARCFGGPQVERCRPCETRPWNPCCGRRIRRGGAG